MFAFYIEYVGQPHGFIYFPTSTIVLIELSAFRAGNLKKLATKLLFSIGAKPENVFLFFV